MKSEKVPVSKKTARIALAVAVSLILITVICGFKGVTGVLTFLDDKKLVSEGVKVTGIVKNVEFIDFMEDSRATLTIEFTANDKIHTVESTRTYYDLTDEAENEITEKTLGNEIVIFYDSENPDRNIVEGSNNKIMKPLFLVFIAYLAGSYFITLIRGK